MKTLKYITIAFLLGINLISCTTDDIGFEDEIIETEVFTTKGSGHLLNDDE